MSAYGINVNRAGVYHGAVSERGERALQLAMEGAAPRLHDAGISVDGFPPKSAITSALDQWLAATAGTPDCSRGAATYSGFDGSEFIATASATCGDAIETLTLTVRHL